MPMRTVVLVSTIALLLAAGVQAAAPRGTLTGIVMRGPVTPVCAVEQPCDEPAASVALLFSQNDRVMGRAVTNAQGRYRLRLPGGVYTVRRSAGRKLDPSRARVYAGRSTRVDFSIDTGIR
jgi:hypothetical protein